MNGVEILNQTIIYEIEYNFATLIISIIVWAIIVCIVCAIESQHWFDGLMGLITGAIIGLFIGGFLCGVTSKETDEIDYIKYQVTVSDEVSLNEFIDKYEILDQEGKIYTVKEKTK